MQLLIFPRKKLRSLVSCSELMYNNCNFAVGELRILKSRRQCLLGNCTHEKVKNTGNSELDQWSWNLKNEKPALDKHSSRKCGRSKFSKTIDALFYFVFGQYDYTLLGRKLQTCSGRGQKGICELITY